MASPWVSCWPRPPISACSSIITREIARDERIAPRLSGIGLALKLLLTLGAVVVLVPISLQRPADTAFATFALGLAVIAASFAEYFGYVFRGLRRVELDAALTLLLRLCVFAFGFAALLLRPSVNGVAACLSDRQRPRRGAGLSSGCAADSSSRC